MESMKARAKMVTMLMQQHLHRLKWRLFTLTVVATFGFGSQLFLEPRTFQILIGLLLPTLGLLNGVFAFHDRCGLTAVGDSAADNCSPKAVWWCRQCVSLIILATLLSVARFLWPANVEGAKRLQWEVVAFFTVTMSMTGAFCGLAFRHVAIASLVTLLTSTIQVAWFCVGIDLYEDPTKTWYMITVWPFPLIWLFATWRHVDDWVRGISIFRKFARLSVTFSITSIVMLVAFAVFRAIEVPAIAHRITRESIIDSLTEDERATDELYRSTLEELRLPIADLLSRSNDRLAAEYLESLTQEFEDRVTVDESAIDQLTMISLRKQGAIRGGPSEQCVIGGTVVAILCGAAKQSASDGNYQKSWQRLFAAMSSLRHLTRNNDWHGVALAYGIRRKLLGDMWDWAIHDDVDAESLREAVRDLTELDLAGCISEATAYQWAYLRATAWFESGAIPTDALQLGLFGRPPYVQHRWVSRIPWENIRIRRLMRYSAGLPHRHDDSVWQSLREWELTTMGAGAYLDYIKGGDLEGQERYYARSESFRVGFAVLEHKARTGALPDTIAELAPEIRRLANIPFDDVNYLILPRGFFDPLEDAPNELLEITTPTNSSFTTTGDTPCLVRGGSTSIRLNEVIDEARTIEDRRGVFRRLRLNGLPLSFRH